jgi:hypothetical protein
MPRRLPWIDEMMPKVLAAVEGGACYVDTIMVDMGYTKDPSVPNPALDVERQRVVQVLHWAVLDGTVEWPVGPSGQDIDGGIRLAVKA